MTLKVWGEFCLFLVGSSGVSLVSALILVYFFFCLLNLITFIQISLLLFAVSFVAKSQGNPLN